MTAKYSVATPVNWQHGDKVMVTPNLSDEQAKEKVRRTFQAIESFHLMWVLLHLISNRIQANCLLNQVMSGRFEHICVLLQFSKGFEKKDVPSGKGYIRLTPQPNT